MTTLSRSFTLQRKTIFSSLSFHISVTSVSPGNTLSAKRTLMLLKRRGSLFAERLDDVARGEAERAEPVEDRLVEAEGLGEGRVGVERVPVAGEAVEERLARRSIFSLDDRVGRAVRRGVDLARTGRARRPSRRRRARTW